MDYFPTQDSQRSIWLENYKKGIETNSATLGLTKEQVAYEHKLCNAMIDAIKVVEQKKREQNSAVEIKNQTSTRAIGELRTIIAQHKTNKAMTENVLKVLGVVNTQPTFDAATFKASITAELFAGFVRIKFKKGDTDGINIYHRKKGENTWRFLARDTRSPYDDHIVLAAPNQPEHWEYRAFGVVNDAEIGQPSDITEIVFGG